MATRNEWAGRKNRESLSKRLGKLAIQIKARDGHACVYCGATREDSGTHLHLDHIIPRCEGGSDEPTNLVLACRSCNCARKTTPIEVWCKQIGVDARTIRAQANKPLPAIERRQL